MTKAWLGAALGGVSLALLAWSDEERLAWARKYGGVYAAAAVAGGTAIGYFIGKGFDPPTPPSLPPAGGTTT